MGEDQTSTKETVGYLSWLNEAWATQAQKIDQWSKKIADLRGQAHLKPGLLNKITALLGQVSFFKAKEQDLLSEINAIERKHRQMRKHGMVKLAEKKPLDEMIAEEEAAPEPQRAGYWLLLWLLALSKKSKTQDKQKFTIS